MEVPAEINLRSLNATNWALNQARTGEYDAILAIQGVNWFMRKIMAMASVTVTMKQWEVNGETYLDLFNKPNYGLPGTPEHRLLTWRPKEVHHPLFGAIRSRSRWRKLAELDDEFQREGWEEGTQEVIEMWSEHLDVDATTSQVMGFEIIDGVKTCTRRLIVRKGEEVLRVRVVYDYLGRVEEVDEVFLGFEHPEEYPQENFETAETLVV